GVPMAGALFLMGDGYLAVFVCVLVPFFLALKSIADSLRRTLRNAVVATRDVTLLATRFDTALNNMPHGLCMLDPRRRLVVANKRLAEILRIDAIARGISLRELLQRAVAVGTLNEASRERALADLESRIAAGYVGELAVDTEDGRA